MFIDLNYNTESRDKTVVLIGQGGPGKTTIFNKCCRKNQRAGPGGATLTRIPQMARSAYGNGFTMIETPGIAGSSDNFDYWNTQCFS